MVRMLLKAHSRVNYRDLAGRTALYFAVVNDNEEMVRILLCFKADPKIQDNKGLSIMNLYFNREKKGNLKIGHHLKLANHQLFRQEFLVEFVYKVHLAGANSKMKDDDAKLNTAKKPKANQNSNDESSAEENAAARTPALQEPV